MLPLLIASALAAKRSDDVVAGGGIDATAGLAFPARDETTNTGGLPQVEGDLGFRTGALSGRIDLDLSVLLVNGHLVPVTLVPEQVWVRVTGGDVYLAAGDLVPPWRAESPDPWDRALTTVSMLSLHAVPREMAGGWLGWNGQQGGLSLLGGVDLGQGVDLLSPPAAWAPDAPFLVGAHGWLRDKGFQVGGGVYYRPETKIGGVEVDGQLDVDFVLLDAQAVAGIHAPTGASLSAELFPDLLVAPAARLEVYGKRGGGALGMVIRPVEFVRVGAEGAYIDGLPSVWVSADIFAPATSHRLGDGGNPDEDHRHR
jgi:hypothetical protein